MLIMTSLLPILVLLILQLLLPITSVTAWVLSSSSLQRTKPTKTTTTTKNSNTNNHHNQFLPNVLLKRIDDTMGRYNRNSNNNALFVATSNSDGNSYNIDQQAQKTVIKSQKQNQKRMIDTINTPMKSTVGDAIDDIEKMDKEIIELVKCIVFAADGRKADNIVALNVQQISTVCSFLIIVTGNSRPQNQAIASTIVNDVQDKLSTSSISLGGNGVPEGSAISGWIVLDYGTVMVHIMTPKSRLYYNVEGQWKEKGGTYYDISNFLLPNNSINNNMESSSMITDYSDDNDDDTSMENDPFWS